jgi:hypothetical protein
MHPDEFLWRQLSPEQEAKQVQRGRDLARLRPWVRIGKIEKHVQRKMLLERWDFTTGELVRLIYCSRHWDQDFNLRKDGDPPPKVKHWMYERVRKSGPYLCGSRRQIRWPRPCRIMANSAKPIRGGCSCAKERTRQGEARIAPDLARRTITPTAIPRSCLRRLTHALRFDA